MSLFLTYAEIATFTDFFVITSGANERQVQAISDEVYETSRNVLGSTAARVEGYKTAEWILLDYGDFIVHVFEQKAQAVLRSRTALGENPSESICRQGLVVDNSSLRRES